MRDRLCAGIILLIAAFLEATFLNEIRLGGVQPELLLLSVLFLGLYKRGSWGFVTGLAAGGLKGIFSLSRSGTNLLVFAIIGLLIDCNRDKLYVENPLTQVFLSFFATLLAGAGYYLLTGLFEGTPLCLSKSMRMITLIGLYTAVISPVVFYILSRFFHAERQW